MNKKRGPYCSPRQRERRKAILDAARHQLEAHGLASVTMKNIAQASNVSTKTLYNLFGNRDLLLLEAASELLDNLEESVAVRNAEPGIPKLLAYTEAAMAEFEYGEFARYIIRILLSAEQDHPLAQVQLGRMQKVAYAGLTIASEQGELHSDVDLQELSHVFAANQWGVALLWEKGMLDGDQLEMHTKLSHYLTLSALCCGKRKLWIDKRCQALMQRHPTAPFAVVPKTA